MFLRILKKDLKRKKTMNVVLLLFVVLCSMFAAASVNNISAVTGGIEYYFDAAGLPDAEVWMGEVQKSDAEERIRALSTVSDVKVVHVQLGHDSKDFIHNGEKLNNFINPAIMWNDAEMGIKYFDKDNNVIESVPKGSFYASPIFLKDTDIKEGDTLEYCVGEKKFTLKYLGLVKGADFYNESNANPNLLLNSEDYESIREAKAESGSVSEPDYKTIYLNTTDIDALKAFEDEYDGVSVSTREDLKGIYLYDMLTAYIFMMISIVLMFTAFVVLRFTIGFTIAEEFREIGVMKAVGIDNGSIRKLYIVKYLAIAVIGTVIGFFGSLPLCDMMMKTVSTHMVLGSESGNMLGIVSSIVVVVLILAFCYLCTRRVRKLSPIDAVRNGQTGERFRKKSLLHLGRSKLPSTGFLAVNDVVSAPKQFSIMVVVFTLLMLLMTIMSNFALTLKSEKLRLFFPITPSHANLMETEMLWDVANDHSNADKLIADVEKTLAENGMPGRCAMTTQTRFEATHGDKRAKINFMDIMGHYDEQLRVDEGSAPQKDDEIAVTTGTLELLDAEIGDRIKAVIGDKEYEFLITGTFSSFIGNSAMVNKGFDFGHLPVDGIMGLAIEFEGDPDAEQVDKNIEKLKEIYDSDKIYTLQEAIKKATGMSDTLNSIKQMIMILTVIVTALIVVLMERSFISKERAEIALMKAVGIPNRSIIFQHSIRFVIVSVIACIISSAILMPISNAMMNAVCNLIGDIKGLTCDIDAIEVFVICPAILIGVTAIGSFLTALYTRTIKASDTASIE